jgi:MFS family permease
MLVQPLFMLAIGRFGERWGKLKLVFWGILGSIATFLIYASAPNVWQILLGQLMIAASWSAIFIGLNLYIIEEVPQGSRGKAFGYLQSALTSAAAVGPLLGGALADALGIREMIVIASLLMISSLPFLLRLRALDRRAQAEPLAGTPSPK